MLSRVTFFLCALGLAHANTFIFNNAPFPDNHIVGTTTFYAIQSLMITTSSTATSGTVTVKINTDYENATLSPFKTNGTSCTPSKGTGCVQPGDFFFTSQSGNSFLYGAALASHGDPNNPNGNLVANNQLYNLGGTDVYTSDQVILGGINKFNSNIDVWINGNTATKDTNVSSFTPAVITPNAGADGITAPLYSITFSVTTLKTDSFFTMVNSGNFGVFFASADCANDSFGGQVPEPGSMLMLSLGIVGICLKSTPLRSTCRRLFKI